MASADEVAQILAATLSPDTTTRISAELRLADFLKAPDAALALSQLAFAQEIVPALRQHSASIALRKYVSQHWSAALAGFRGPEPPEEIKAQIRQAVFQGLSDPNSKIRSLCAQILSLIANSDWPFEYPDLLNALLGLLSSNSPSSVHGAMQVFTEFMKSDLTEDQILPVLRQLLPVLHTIITSSEHSPLTRSRGVSVFRQCVETLNMVKGQHPASVKEAVGLILPAWIVTLQALLVVDPRQDIEDVQYWDGLEFRLQIFKTIEVINMSFYSSLAPHVKDVLATALRHLDALYPAYVQHHFAADGHPGLSEGEPLTLPQFVCPLLDLLAQIVHAGRARSWAGEGQNRAALVGAVLRWVQMTADDEEEWATDPNAFVAQEADEYVTYSVRMAGFDLLGALVDASKVPTIATLQSALQHIVAESEQERKAGRQDWWRPLEGALAAVGAQAEDVLECVADETDAKRPAPLDIEALLGKIIPPLLALSECPFLQGRAFVFASQYSKLLPVDVAGQYLDAAVQVLEADSTGVPVKVSALRAVHNFCSGIDKAVLVPMAQRIAKDIGPFLSQTSEDTLTLVLETLAVVLNIDGGSWLAVDLAQPLITAVLDVWVKNNKDPIFLSLLTQILQSLAGSRTPGVYETVVKQALLPLCSAMLASTQEETWITNAAIELVCSLIEGAPEAGLGDGFVSLLAPSLLAALSTVEDRDVQQNGIMCLTQLVRKDCAQLLAWIDPSTGQSGLDSVLAVIAQQLQNENEAGGLGVGELIIHLLRRAGERVLPVLPELLQALIARMLTAKTATFIQSLVIPFAFLINNQRDTVLDLLEKTAVQGRPALDVLIQTWCENGATFCGFWAPRVSTLALCLLYASERPSLQSIMVKGEMIIKESQEKIIMTRSQTKKMPTEFEYVPFPVKALKLILLDMRTGAEPMASSFFGEPGEEEDDDEWADEGERPFGVGFREELAFLSDMLDPKKLMLPDDDEIENDDDDDLMNDPISQMDLKAHTVHFLRQRAAVNPSKFNATVSRLTREEMVIVQLALRDNAPSDSEEGIWHIPDPFELVP